MIEQNIYYYTNPKGVETSMNKFMERLGSLIYKGLPMCSDIYPFVERATDTQNENKPIHFVYDKNYTITTPNDERNFIVFFERGATTELVREATQETAVSMICWFYEGLMTNEKRLDITLAQYIKRRVIDYFDYYFYDATIVDRDSIWGNWNNESFLVNDAPYNAFRIDFTMLSDVPCYLTDEFSIDYNPNPVNFMFEEFEFTTEALQTTQVLDFFNLGIFTQRNRPFVYNFYKRDGALLQAVLLGEVSGVTDQGEDVTILNPRLSINESTNIFSFTELAENTTYKICVIQKQNA